MLQGASSSPRLWTHDVRNSNNLSLVSKRLGRRFRVSNHLFGHVFWPTHWLSLVFVYEIKSGSLPEDEGYEGDCDDEDVEQVKARAAEGALVQDEPVGNQLHAHLNREDAREEVVEVVQHLQIVLNLLNLDINRSLGCVNPKS